MAQSKINKSCAWISNVLYTTTLSACIFLLYLSQTDGNPLVYPNRFSFQKTTSTTTAVPMHNTSSTESDLKTSYSKSFRYDIAAWSIGAVLLVCFLVVIVYPRAKRRNEVISSSCYMFPASTTIKAETDSTSIIGNTISETS